MYIILRENAIILCMNLSLYYRCLNVFQAALQQCKIVTLKENKQMLWYIQYVLNPIKRLCSCTI